MMKIRRVFLVILVFIFVGCSKDLPEPEMNHEQDIKLDPVQMDYKNLNPTVLK